MPTPTKKQKEFKSLDKYSNLLDSSIRIPGTQKTIGLDPLLGLIPGVGDVAGYSFSMVLIYNMVKYGASKRLVLKMMGNVILDSTIGFIPLVGTIFDFVYKSNDRNVRLFREYHDDGMHRESTMPLFLGLMAISFVFLFALAFVAWWVFSSIGEWMSVMP